MNSHYLSAFFLLLIVFHCSLAAAETEWFEAGTWIGTFEQSSPVKWKGKMILFLRYELNTDYPWSVSGKIFWPDLGQATTSIKGNRKANRLEFKELECLKSGCLMLKLGGSYRGTFNSSEDELTGTARLDKFKLKGRFKLKRMQYPDQRP